MYEPHIVKPKLQRAATQKSKTVVPNLFDLATPFVQKRLAPPITCSSKGVQITTDLIKTLLFHMLDSMCVHAYAKQPHVC